MAKPLHRLTERNAHFKWTVECQRAFEDLRGRLTTTPVLAYPDYTKPFILDTDVSDFGIGAVLAQHDEDGQERVVAFASRTLSKAERRYCVTRRELLAVVVFTQHFRPYLLGRELVLRTDHGSLTWLQSFKEPEGQLARWLEKLQEFNFSILHRKGKNHQNADALSRLPCKQCGREEEPNAIQISTASREDSDSPSEQEAMPEMRELQEGDPDLLIALQAKEANRMPDPEVQKAQSLETRRLLQLWEQLVIRNGILFRRWESDSGSAGVYQLVVPKSQRKDILRELHEGVVGGHLGEAKVLGKLKERFYWPGHATDVKNWCRTCSACAQRKTPAPKNEHNSSSCRQPYADGCSGHIRPIPQVRERKFLHPGGN